MFVRENELASTVEVNRQDYMNFVTSKWHLDLPFLSMINFLQTFYDTWT